MGSLGQFSPKMGLGNMLDAEIGLQKISVIIGSVRTAGGQNGQFGAISPKMGMGNAHKNKRKHLKGASLTCRMLKLDCKKFLRS